MDKRAYWIWIQQAFGPGSKKPARLASQYAGGVQEFCEGGPKLWNTRRDLTDRETAALRDFSISQAEARQVLKALGKEPLSIAQLEETTGLPAASLLGVLTELEVEGLAESLPGKRYIRVI